MAYIMSVLGLIALVLLVLLRRSNTRLANWKRWETERQNREDYPMLALRAWQIVAKRTFVLSGQNGNRLTRQGWQQARNPKTPFRNPHK